MPTVDERQKTNAETPNWISSEVPKTNLESVNEDSANMLPIKCNDILGADPLIDTGIYRSHSSLSQHSACSFRASPPFEAVAEAVDAYHSLPLSMLEVVDLSYIRSSS